MTEFRTPLQAGNTSVYTVDIESGGSPVPVVQIEELTVTLVDKNEEIINNREDQDVLNTNGGVVTDGHFALTLTPTDMAMDLDDPARVQTRYLHIRITLVGGATRQHEVLFYIQGDHIPSDN